MKNFWGSFLGAILGNIAIGIISTIIIIVVMVGMFSSTFSGSSSSSEETISSETILKVSLNYNVKDRPSMDPLAGFNFSSFDSKFELGLNELLPLLKYAAKDDKIKGLYLEVGAMPSGIATLEEVRQALLEFKKSGKFIVAYSYSYSQKAYYLSTVADEIYLNPHGDIDFKGLGGAVEFYKKVLDKIGVKAEAIRPTGNRYKSAVEPYINEKMSPANREQMTLLFNTIWSDIIAAISVKTGQPGDTLNALANRLGIEFPEDAQNYNFVTSLLYEDEVHDLLKKKINIADDKDLNLVRIETYYKKNENKLRKSSGSKVAVIYASGSIIRGKGWDGIVGSDDFVKTIRAARKDKDIKAIVLRVNSPGGDALASELIYREVILAKKEKPVVVSMGNYAASGGYYIACAADTIVADHNTLTGSIGVFGLMFNTAELFTQKIGISFDTVKTHRYSDFPNTNRPFAEREKEVLQNSVDRIYDVFISHVAEGRNMSKADVDSIAQGRVWTGKDALEIGLVDMIGGLDTTISIAARMAGLKEKEYEVTTLPADDSPLNKLLRDISTSTMIEAYLDEKFGEYTALLKRVEEIKNMKGVQARLPYYIHME